MTTSPLSRRAGAARTGAAAALAVLATATTASIGAPVAFAAPGDEGELRIHRVGAPLGVPKDDSKVCRFYLDATNFDGATTVTYTIEAQPPLPNTATLTGAIILAAGVGRTEPLALPDGQYKLTWPVPRAPPPPRRRRSSGSTAAKRTSTAKRSTTARRARRAAATRAATARAAPARAATAPRRAADTRARAAGTAPRRAARTARRAASTRAAAGSPT
ncbi:hypothetical protein SAVCW2_12130 [Streptomyces avermitilis]|uniref:Secreted protein n=1 Tax=Streptomyces avermitilis TaxID=33903 RepID=A0A4D4MN77_STRAX|nr:hypothetical protein SAV31267_023840 [Streptomyces avermitilis]GDY82014.1 hypothetical protein SAVCW2_12130 [Streptomyces avermitilis]